MNASDQNQYQHNPQIQDQSFCDCQNNCILNSKHQFCFKDRFSTQQKQIILKNLSTVQDVKVITKDIIDQIKQDIQDSTHQQKSTCQIKWGLQLIIAKMSEDEVINKKLLNLPQEQKKNNIILPNFPQLKQRETKTTQLNQISKSLFQTFQPVNQKNFNIFKSTQIQKTTNQVKQPIKIKELQKNRISTDSSGFFKLQQFPSFSKKQTNKDQTKLKRKIKPTQVIKLENSLSNQEKIQCLDQYFSDCHLGLDRKNKKYNPKQGSSVNQNSMWYYHEYFYCNYDRLYFKQQNNFSKIVRLMGIDSQKTKFKQIKMIKKAIPPPKPFSLEFICSQQTKLHQFRGQLRQIPKNKSKNQDLDLTVNKQIVALHPVCGHLHAGTILAIYKENQYMVKFIRPELGTQKILDINISSKSVTSAAKAAIQNIDFDAMALVIKLLEYKGQLLQKFKQYNEYCQKMNQQNDGKQSPLDNRFLQQYGWIGSTICIVSVGLRHVLAKFRMRGVFPSNQQLVGKNFTSLLLNPLNLMSKQLQNSSQHSDANASITIKKIVQNRNTARSQDYLENLAEKYGNKSQQSQMNPQNKERIQKLVKSGLGMLINLRYQGRQFDIQSNKHLNTILSLVDAEYPQYFNQIYSKVRSIVKKINEE